MLRELIRIITAIIFIISGLVKAIDPVGFSFKMEEYFSPAVFNLEIFTPYALAIAVFVVILELVLGLFLLLKIHLRLTLFTLISLCIFFGFLTFYSAYYNVVTDCGCFGDAIKFTPWQSFTKDIVLLAMLLFLWFKYKVDFPTKSQSQWKNLVIVLVFMLPVYIIKTGIDSEPIIDFRDYKIGTNIKSEKEKIAQNPSEHKIIYTLRNTETNQEIEVNQDEYISEGYWENSLWEILSDKTKSVISKQGYSSAIDKFEIEDSKGNVLTEKIINAPRVILIFTYKPEEISTETLLNIENKINGHKEKALIYGVAPVPNVFKVLPSTTMDATAIKTIARSNPFVLVLSNATITEKMSVEDWLKLNP